MAKKKVFLLFLEYIFSDPKDSMSLFSYICFNLISISVDYLDIMLYSLFNKIGEYFWEAIFI